MVEHDVSDEFVGIVSSFYQRVVSLEESYCAPCQIIESEEYLGKYTPVTRLKIPTKILRIHVRLQICRGDLSR
jgi:hypothetical protein